MNVILNNDTLVFDQVGVQLMVMIAAIILQVVRIPWNVNIVNQLGKLALNHLLVGR